MALRDRVGRQVSQAMHPGGEAAGGSGRGGERRGVDEERVPRNV